MLAGLETRDDPLDLRRHARGGVDEEQDEVGIPGTGPGGGDHRPVEPAPRLEDAGRIDQQDLRLALDRDPHQPRAGGLRLVADDGYLLADQRIDQSRLAGVGRADDGGEAGACHCSCASRASAAAFSASCLLVPSAVASPSFATDTRIVNEGA